LLEPEVEFDGEEVASDPEADDPMTVFEEDDPADGSGTEVEEDDELAEANMWLHIRLRQRMRRSREERR
jgi:hypothetical protein